MLTIGYRTKEEINKELRLGKMQRYISDYIRELYQNEIDYADNPKMIGHEPGSLNKETILEYFEMEHPDYYMSYEDLTGTGKNANKEDTVFFRELIQDIFEDVTAELELKKELAKEEEIGLSL